MPKCRFYIQKNYKKNFVIFVRNELQNYRLGRKYIPCVCSLFLFDTVMFFSVEGCRQLSTTSRLLLPGVHGSPDAVVIQSKCRLPAAQSSDNEQLKRAADKTAATGSAQLEQRLHPTLDPTAVGRWFDVPAVHLFSVRRQFGLGQPR